MIHLSKRYAYDGKLKKSKVYTEENLEKIKKIHKDIRNGTGEGGEMLGWYNYINLPETAEVLEKMLALYRDWQEKKINTVIVSAIGGSALGARAAIHMCVNKYMFGSIKIIWMDSISPTGNAELLRHLKKAKIRPAGIVISKSGTTLETLIGYRFIKAVLTYKYEEDIADKLAIVTGEEENNKLRKLANRMNYPIFSIPKNVGGRFSSLTPAGLLPMIMQGVDVFQVIEGAKDALKDCNKADPLENSAYDYALHRYLYEQYGYTNHIIGSYEKKLGALLEQAKQLMAETEAKTGLGLMPIPVTYTKDLHSVGQYLQDGPKTYFETTLWVRKSSGNAKIPMDINSNDGMDVIDGMWLSEINKLIYKSVAESHAKVAGAPVLLLEIDRMAPYDYGYFYMWMSISVTMTAYLLGVNPFNQPGVEAYKAILRSYLKELKMSLELKKSKEDDNYIDEFENSEVDNDAYSFDDVEDDEDEIQVAPVKPVQITSTTKTPNSAIVGPNTTEKKLTRHESRLKK